MIQALSAILILTPSGLSKFQVAQCSAVYVL